MFVLGLCLVVDTGHYEAHFPRPFSLIDRQESKMISAKDILNQTSSAGTPV